MSKYTAYQSFDGLLEVIEYLVVTVMPMYHDQDELRKHINTLFKCNSFISTLPGLTPVSLDSLCPEWAKEEEEK